ncbi:MAG: dihydrofolate reductase [Ignavibacteriales bacterium]|nr:dihydrofolate reductase [Ignavibacteriales bacterium]
MKLIIIAALTPGRVIGNDGTIPWHYSEDLKRFKRLTIGQTVLMGRKTYESLGKPLPGRTNVVITKSKIAIPTGADVIIYPTLEEALLELQDREKVFVVGGGTIYAQLIERADAMHLTMIEQEAPGDTYFPEYEHLIGTMYRFVGEEKHKGFSFQDYIRLASAENDGA